MLSVCVQLCQFLSKHIGIGLIFGASSFRDSTYSGHIDYTQKEFDLHPRRAPPRPLFVSVYPAYDIANTTVFYEAHRIPIAQSERYSTDGRIIDSGLTIHIPEPPSYPEVLRMDLESAGRK